jgi:hypothetical protein
MDIAAWLQGAAGSSSVPGHRIRSMIQVTSDHRRMRSAPSSAVADGLHSRHHLVAGDLRRSVESADPRAAGMIAFVGVNLGIQYRHDVLHGTECYAASAYASP